MVKVSVLIPIYNAEKYLEECLSSVINQTLKEIEIICINDGSTDSSAKIVGRYADSDSRIRVITKKNTGYGHSLNVGLDFASGEYVSIVESDDYIDCDMLCDLYERAKADDLDCIKADSKMFVYDENGNKQFSYLYALPDNCRDLYNKITCFTKDSRVFKGYVYTWSGIYKRDYLNRNNIRHHETPGASYQDNGFWFQTIMHAQRLAFINKSYYYLRRDNPNSSVKSKEKIFCICDEYDFIRNRILKSDIVYKKKLLQIAFYYRYLNYKFHYQRIADEYKNLMMERIQKDIICAFENGEIDVSMYEKEQWVQLWAILHEGKMASLDSALLSDRIKKCIKSATDIYIYGAGTWGKWVYKKLQEISEEKKVRGFCVSIKQKEEDFLLGLPIVQFNETQLTKDVLIVVAVADRKLGEVLTIIKQSYHENYILKNDLF